MSLEGSLGHPRFQASCSLLRITSKLCSSAIRKKSPDKESLPHLWVLMKPILKTGFLHCWFFKKDWKDMFVDNCGESLVRFLEKGESHDSLNSSFSTGMKFDCRKNEC